MVKAGSRASTPIMLFLVLMIQVSACGVGPIAAAAQFAKEKGAKQGILLDYSTSADVTGEESCVGYASLVFL